MSEDNWRVEVRELVEFYHKNCKKGKKGCIHNRMRLRSDIISLNAFVSQLEDIMRSNRR